MLLVFVVETAKTNDSDRMYIDKYLVSRFPMVKTGSGVVIQWVYLNGKTNYNKGNISKQINDYKSRYLKYHLQAEDVYVLYCIDTDDADKNKDSVRLNKEISDFCNNKGYRLIWFNKTIEHVFLGKLVKQAKDKKSEAACFFKKHMSSEECCENKYNGSFFSETQVQTSNIGCVLNEVFLT